MNKRCFCVLLGLFFYILYENKLQCFLNVKKYRHLWWELLRYTECAFETWNLNTKKKASENVLQKIVQEKKFPELTAEKAKLKVKTISTKNSVELIKSKKSCSRIKDVYILRFLWIKQALPFLRGVWISRPSVSTSVNRYKELIFQKRPGRICVCVWWQNNLLLCS